MQSSMHISELFSLRTLFFLLGLMSTALPVQSQTKFERPDTAPNYAVYRNLDECIVAISRQIRQYDDSLRFWKDTGIYEREKMFEPYPTEQQLIGKECFEKFTIDSLSEKTQYQWLGYLLQVGRIEEMWTLSTKILNALPDSRRYSFIAFIASQMSDHRPFQFQRLLDLIEMEKQRIPQDSVLAHTSLQSTRLWILNEIRDSVLIPQELDKYLELYRHLPSAQKITMGSSVAAFYNVVSFNEMMDSISAGSKAHLDYRRNVHSIAFENAIPFDSVFFETDMPPILTDFWYFKPKVGRDSTPLKKIQEPIRIPSAGKVNVISFIDGCSREYPDIRPGRRAGSSDCTAYYSVLARLQKKFPEVEFTTVTKTFGFVGNSAMLTPDAEADSLAKQYMNHWGLAGYFTVGVTEYFRIPGLDRRRIDEVPKYRTELEKVALGLGGNNTSIMVDRAGKIVSVISLNQKTEEDAEKTIEAIVKRK